MADRERFFGDPAFVDVPLDHLLAPATIPRRAALGRAGAAFGAMPAAADGSWNAPVIPGLGIIPSNCGSQSRPDPEHPAGVGPGKWPRLTPDPAMAILADDGVMPFGTPGGDVQIQAMLPVGTTGQGCRRPLKGRRCSQGTALVGVNRHGIWRHDIRGGLDDNRRRGWQLVALRHHALHEGVVVLALDAALRVV